MAGKVVRSDDAIDWARVGFGVEDGAWELRLLRGALGCDRLGVSILKLAAGTKVTTGHGHPDGEEVYVLVAGRAEMKIDADVVELEPLSALRVRGQEIRAVRVLEDAIFVVASHPQDDARKTRFVPGFWPAEEGERGLELELKPEHLQPLA